jgi:DnaJ-class molecular chaperone
MQVLSWYLSVGVIVACGGTGEIMDSEGSIETCHTCDGSGKVMYVEDSASRCD